MTLDSKALSHVLSHSYDWQKPEEVRTSLSQILGEGNVKDFSLLSLTNNQKRCIVC